MSSLEYFTGSADYPFASHQAKHFHYAQAVTIGDIVKCSGQGGFTPTSGEVDPNDVEGQIERAFQNVELVLKSVGLRGWEDVFSIRSYHIGVERQLPAYLEALKRWTPNHTPLQTGIGVTELGMKGAVVELEVEAYRGKA